MGKVAALSNEPSMWGVARPEYSTVFANLASIRLICAMETVFCPTHAVGNSLITGSSGPL